MLKDPTALTAGDQSLLVAGGMESMSGVPYYLPALRGGGRMGHVQAVDGLIKDGEEAALVVVCVWGGRVLMCRGLCMEWVTNSPLLL
jgi:acetyl-CoA acetyltransferase